MYPVSLSICVPAFNEEGGLKGAVEDLLSTLSPLVRGLEIIIVDDGSTDLTARIAAELTRQYPQVKMIQHRRNLGIGVSYRDGLEVARGDFYSWFPADRENSAEEFKQCLAHLGGDTITICHHQGQDLRPPMRKMVSSGYTWFLNKCFHLDLKYYNGLAIFPVAALRPLRLKAEGFVFLAESLIKAMRSGYRVIELPAPLRKRGSGRSKALGLPAIRQMANDILRILLKRDSRIMNPEKS
jgi:glycosyltransferase involved in cell wall biosynthesis